MLKNIYRLKLMNIPNIKYSEEKIRNFLDNY